MPDLCPLCMSPLVNEQAVEITEDPVVYDELARELDLDPVAQLSA